MTAKKKTTTEEPVKAIAKPLVSARMTETLKKQIVEKLLGEKKYLDSHYTARKMAEELGTNHRYLSVVLREEFHTNYTSLVNKYRVEEAMSILTDWRFRDMNIEDVSDKVGFAHRQSFYTAFVRFTGTTPHAFRQHYEENNRKN